MVVKCVSIICAAAKGNPVEFSLCFKDLLPSILQDVQSPLAAPYLTKLYIDLRKTVFHHDLNSLGELIAHVTLRLLKPQCDLDSAWEEEDLTKAMIRTVNCIHKRTLKKKDEELDVGVPQNHFTTPAFSYSFSLLKSTLLSSHCKKDEGLIHNCLQIIAEHAKLRGNHTADTLDLYLPKYLPRQQMFELLVELISMYFYAYLY